MARDLTNPDQAAAAFEKLRATRLRLANHH